MHLVRSLIITVPLALAACAHQPPPTPESPPEPRLVLLEAAREPQEVKAAIVQALQAKGWVTEKEEGTEITARLSHRGTEMQVVIGYDAQRVSLRASDVQSARGNQSERYVANLEAMIRERLKPRAAAEAPRRPPPTLVVFEKERTRDEAQVLLQAALAQHHWVLEEQRDEALVARLSHRKGSVRIRITFEPRQASLAYLASEGISFDEAGRSDDYERWMRNLVDAARSQQ